MKKELKYSLMLLFAIHCMTVSYAGDTIRHSDGKDFRKVISKKFTVSPSTKLTLNNRYGKIEIVEGIQNEVQCEITIIAMENSQSKAQKTLDRISIDFQHSTDFLSVQTYIEENNSWFSWGSECNNMEINYKIIMPTNLNMDITHKYGDIIMPNFFGKLNIGLGYGHLVASDFNKDADLDIKYSEARIGCAKNIAIDFSYSQLQLSSCDNLRIDGKYSEYEIGHARNITATSKYSEYHCVTADNLTFDGAYDHVNLGEIDNINLQNKYGELTIDRLLGNLVVKASYNECEIKGLGTKASNLKFSGDYSNITINSPAAYQYNISGKYLSTDIKGGNDDQDEDGHVTVIKGSKGSGGKAMVYIEGNYLEVTLK